MDALQKFPLNTLKGRDCPGANKKLSLFVLLLDCKFIKDRDYACHIHPSNLVSSTMSIPTHSTQAIQPSCIDK